MNNNESLRRVKSYGTRAFLGAAILLCLIILLNTVLSVLPARLTRFDVSGTGLTELSAESEKLLDGLDTDVTVYWLCEGGVVDPTLIGEWFPLLLTRYEEASDRIKVVKITDSEADKKLLEDLGADGLGNHGLIVASDKRSRVIDVSELFTYSSQFVNVQLNNGNEMELTLEQLDQMVQMVYAYYQIDITQYAIYNHSSVANTKLTSAIDYVTAENVPHAYLLTGFRGASMPDTLQTYIGILNEGLEELDISKVSAIPADAGVVILHAPTEDISEAQAAIINAYLEQGGSLVLTTSPNTHVDQCPNLQKLTTPFGLSAQPGIVFDSADGYYASGASTDVLTPKVSSSHELYQLAQGGSYPHRMPWSHGIEIAKTLPTGVSALGIMTTSSSAVRKEAGGVTETLGDPAPTNVAVEAYREVAVTDDGTASVARILWFGSTEAFAAETASAARGNYYYLALGADIVRNAFVSDYEAIPGVRIATEALDSMGDVLGFTIIGIITVVIPVGLLITGVVIWSKRRRRH